MITPMTKERFKEFVAACREGKKVRELCIMFHISSGTVFYWKQRARKEGIDIPNKNGRPKLDIS